MLLIGPSAHVALAAQKVTPEALRRLAFLVGGTGGTGMPSARWGPTWYGAGGGGVRLDWELQTSCTHLDFAIPWRYISWQADSADAHHDLPLGSMNANDLPIAKKLQTQLRALASLPHDEQVPDGAVPCALAPLLGLLGMDADDRTTCIHQLTWAILRAVANGFELHKAHTVHHWQLVGVPLLGLGSHQHQDLAECHACQQSCRALFRIKPQDGQADSDIINNLCSKDLDAGLDSQCTVTAHRLMRQHCAWEGASVCFLCAAPVVAAKYARQRHARNDSQTRRLAITAERRAIGVSVSAECCLTRIEARKVTPLQATWQKYHNILLARSFSATKPPTGDNASALHRGTIVRVCTALPGGRTFPSIGSVGAVVLRQADLSVRRGAF